MLFPLSIPLGFNGPWKIWLKRQWQFGMKPRVAKSPSQVNMAAKFVSHINGTWVINEVERHPHGGAQIMKDLTLEMIRDVNLSNSILPTKKKDTFFFWVLPVKLMLPFMGTFSHQLYFITSLSLPTTFILYD